MHDIAQPAQNPDTTPGLIKRIGILALLVAAVLVMWGIFSRRHADQTLTTWTHDQAVPTVTVVRPRPTGVGDALVLPGTVQALNSAPIYARTNGYVRRWFVDIGTSVKAGQLLAVIDAPEVEQQLAQSRADLQTAKANENLAATTADRWQALLKQDAVSKQETDERTGDLAAKRAVTNASEANVERLKALIGFTQITAPFSGVVTSRATQIGQLVTAGNGAAMPLFTVSDTSRMRVYIRVPQAYSAEIGPGLHISLSLPEYPGRSFDAVVMHTAQAVDQQSGTVLVEAQAANADKALKPGAYAQVRFPLESIASSVTVRASAVLYRSDGTRVATVDAQNRVKLHAIIIGRDSGDALEVTSGLSVTDRIVDNPPDGIEDGDRVRVDAQQAQEGKARVAG